MNNHNNGIGGRNFLQLSCHIASFKVRGHFTISRGSATSVRTLEIHARRGEYLGFGEGSPERSGIPIEKAMVEVQSFITACPELATLDRFRLQHLLPAGPVRNAIDLALWDLEAKERRLPVWQLAGVREWCPVTTAYTISIDSTDKMEQAAREAAWRPLLKIKLNGENDLDRVSAVRRGAPNARLIIDANESWHPEQLAGNAKLGEGLAQLGVELIEQPLPRGLDDILCGLNFPIPFCADESCRDLRDLPRMVGRYQWINVKLDKCGGLTEGLAIQQQARSMGLKLMTGSMLASSLAVAPALLLAADGDLADLDAHLLLENDRSPGLRTEGSIVHPPDSRLWGGW